MHGLRRRLERVLSSPRRTRPVDPAVRTARNAKRLLIEKLALLFLLPSPEAVVFLRNWCVLVPPIRYNRTDVRCARRPRKCVGQGRRVGGTGGCGADAHTA